jgi:hypothetical protein
LKRREIVTIINYRICGLFVIGNKGKEKQNRPDLGQLAWWAWGFVWPSRKKNKIYKKGPFGLLVGFKAQ